MLYEIYAETIENEELGIYQSYGIRYGKNLFIQDVSTRPEPLQEFVNQLNKFKSNVQYIYELIDSFFALL